MSIVTAHPICYETSNKFPISNFVFASYLRPNRGSRGQFSDVSDALLTLSTRHSDVVQKVCKNVKIFEDTSLRETLTLLTQNVFCSHLFVPIRCASFVTLRLPDRNSTFSRRAVVSKIATSSTCGTETLELKH